MNRAAISCLFLIEALGFTTLGQTITVDSVTVDSVWNSDTSVNGMTESRHSVKISFVPVASDSVVYFVHLSLDRGKTWFSSIDLFDAVGVLAGSFKVAANRKTSTVVRLKCGDTTNVVFMVECCVASNPVSIAVDGSSNIAPISSRQLGTNLGTWGASVKKLDVVGAIRKVGAQMVRWPGGSSADLYHWQNQSQCLPSDYNTNPWTYQSHPAWDTGNTFDNFMNLVVIPGGLEACITVNFGTNIACNAGADPNEAAAWVAYAKAHNYNSHVHYWTVGNELYGGWEYDLHLYPPPPAGQFGGTGKHLGTVYAAAMAGDSGFYAKMKAADPTAQIGAVVEGLGLNWWDGWDTAVIKHAPYDYIEFHWYAQTPGKESDRYLLNQAPAVLRSWINTLRSSLAKAGGNVNTPIMLGEFNSVSSAQAKQTMSIINALFIGMSFGEILNNNVSIATMWFCYGGTQGCNNNNSDTLYGWQNFGGYDEVAGNTASNWNSCNGNNGPIIPEGTVFPAGNAAKLVSLFAVPGNHMLRAVVSASLPNVRAYAATQGSGYSLMLFNLDSSSTAAVNVGVFGAPATSFTGSTVVYSKLQYDDSKNNVWTGPVSASLGTVGANCVVSLPPWSMTVLKMN